MSASKEAICGSTEKDLEKPALGEFSLRDITYILYYKTEGREWERAKVAQ